MAQINNLKQAFKELCKYYLLICSLSACIVINKVIPIFFFKILLHDLASTNLSFSRLTYQYDYYKSKSVEDIANKIAVNPDRVMVYVERNKTSYTKNQIKGLSEFGDVTLKTEVKDISSYGILKELQLIDRQLGLTITSKEIK